MNPNARGVIAAFVVSSFLIFGCGIAKAADPYGWGRNNNGQLGDGTTTTPRTLPVATIPSGALAGKVVTAISNGDFFTVALTSDGKVYAWGLNGDGQLGDGSTTNRTSPVAVNMSGVLSGKVVTAIAAGAYHTVVLTSEGKVYAWGLSQSGQLGNGSFATTPNPNPIGPVAGLLSGKTVTAISAGFEHTMAITNEGGGKAYGWGYNLDGELGNNDTTGSNVATPVAVYTGGVLAGKVITAISAGAFHTIALTSEPKVYGWGNNSDGEVGDGTSTTPYFAPVGTIMTGVLAGETVTAITAGDFHTLARTSDGQLFSWGFNQYGQLGDGTPTTQMAPVAVNMTGALAGKTVNLVTAGVYHTLALASDGKAYAWGNNQYGQVGDGTTSARFNPTGPVAGLLVGKNVTAIGGGGNHSTALTTPAPTPTPNPTLSISGSVAYCVGSARSVPSVTLDLTGSITASTTTDTSGVYQFSSVTAGGNYTVTPSKGDLPSGGVNTPGIDTADASAVQRHFLGVTLLSGCGLQASRTSPDNTGSGPDTRDANAIQRFYLGLIGTGDAGKWRFNPNNRMYQPLSGDQVGQNYDTYVLGDVTGDLVFPGSAPMPMDVSALAGVATVTLPTMAVPSSAGNFGALVSASNIDAGKKLIAFQGDFSFDSSVVSFQSLPVARAGLTAGGNWALAANVLGTGKIKTLRVSCFALDADSVLAGEGPLFELRLSRVSGKPGASTALVWSAEPNNFIFIDENAKRRAPGSTPPGKLTWTRPTGKR